jgi:phage terminase large subunit GpA-like protein
MTSQTLLDAYRQGQRPPIQMTVDQWADEYRYLDERSGKKWRTSKVEVARGPMRSMTEPGVRTVTLMTCTQLLKTETLLNTAGYFMHLDPCAMLMVFPKDDVAKKFSNFRLKKMIRATPVLNDLVTDQPRRDATDTAQFKEFPGGQVMMVGANAPANLAMFPIRVVLSDEIDKYEASSGEEGDPIDLAEERTSTYTTNSLCVRACSPTVKDMSRIEASYKESDMRQPFVACPHCDLRQVMRFSAVKWDRNEDGEHLPDTACYACVHCGVAWREDERLDALATVQWRQTADFVCGCGHKNKPSTWDCNEQADRWVEVYGVMRARCESCNEGLCPNHHAGFWASKLYSPFRDLTTLVRKFLAAKGHIEKLRAFVNTQLAETFEESGERIEDVDFLLARREQYEAELPTGVGVITAGVDVQNNRLEVELVGWGMDEESWSLAHHVIPGDLNTPEPWAELWEYLNRPLYRADGKLSYVAAAAIDMQGNHTQQVMNFDRHTINRKFWAIRGVGGEGKPIPVWPKNPGRYHKGQTPFYGIGVDAAKNMIFARLSIPDPGPGYSHFPIDRSADWFKQLTAEKRVRKKKGTQSYYIWQNPKNERNEAFDCRVYAYAALCGLQAQGWQVNIITKEQRLVVTQEYEDRRQQSLARVRGVPMPSKPPPQAQQTQSEAKPAQQVAQPRTVTKAQVHRDRGRLNKSRFMDS